LDHLTFGPWHLTHFPALALDSSVLHGSGLMKPWTIKTPPRRSPNAYELAWYDNVVARQTTVSIPHNLSRSTKAWFERRFIARAIVAFHRNILSKFPLSR
jgi:hypothetical protein